MRVTAHNRGPERRDAAPAAARSGSATPGRWRRRRDRKPARCRAATRRRRSQVEHASDSASYRSALSTATPSCSSPRTRRTRRACSACRAHGLLQGRVPRVRRRRRRGRREPGSAPARRPPRTIAVSTVPAGRLARRCGCASRPTPRGDAVRRLRRRRSPRGAARPTSSTPRCSADMPDADARAGAAPGLRGMIWTKQFYYYDVPSG